MENLTHGAAELACYIDHTLLKADATTSEIEQHCREALENNFFSVCIPPSFVSLAAKILKKSPVQVCTVIGFPFGYNMSAAKTFEAKAAITHGAQELDMVINIGALKGGEAGIVLDDIRSVVAAAQGHVVKVILETCYLSDDEKRLACELAMKAGAQFVKTSTGFGPKGATESDVALMAVTVNGKLGVKASGGIRDTETAQRMIAVGATRLGTSQSIAIVRGLLKTSNESSY